jgi:anaerobic magnesium-protoporphyrin IX monomethyl ester cyclase
MESTSWATTPDGTGTTAPDLSPFGLVLTFYQRDPAYALGLASLSAYAKRELADLRVHLVPIFRDDPLEKIAALVAELSPGLVAMSAMSPTWLASDPYLRAIRATLPATPIVVGGYQGIVSPEETIAHPAVDYVCVGDGEEPLVELIRRLRGEVPADGPIAGLWDKRPSGEIRRTPPLLVRDLDGIPFPDYSIFDRPGGLAYLSPRAIQSPRLITVPVLSGRGCPYRCSYCANTTLLDLHGIKSGFLRKYESVGLTGALAALRDRYAVDYFQFWDEEFLYDMRYARTLLPRYRDEVGLPFSMFVRVENMSDELCRVAADAGCHSMWFGIESGSESYRREHLGRRMSNDVIVAAAEKAARHGIKRFCFNMVGLPFESRAHVDETLALSRRIAPELTVFSQYVPLPGTPMFELCRRYDLLLPPSIEHQMWPLGPLNIREHAGSMSAAEMADAAAEIMDYLATHNRLEA